MTNFKQYLNEAKKAYNELIDSIQPFCETYSRKVRKIDVQKSMEQFDILLQYSLLIGALGEGRIAPQELVLINKITRYGDIVKFLGEVTNKELVWEDLLANSASDVLEFLKPFANKVLNNAIDVANILIDVIQRVEEGQYLFNYISLKCLIIASTLVNIDNISKEEEVHAILNSQIFIFLTYIANTSGVKVPSAEEIGEFAKSLNDKSNITSCETGDIVKKKPLKQEDGNAILVQKQMKSDFAIKKDNNPDYKIDYETKELGVALICVQKEEGLSTGSGFVISDDGYLFTCHHVVDGATNDEIKIYLSDEEDHKKQYDIEIAYKDPENDRAVLKIINKDNELFHYYDLEENFKQVKTGDDVAIFGYLLGLMLNDSIEELMPTLTKGYIGSKNRIKGKPCYYLDIRSAPGHSGAPVFRLADKKVIGYLCGSWGIEDNQIVFIRPLEDFLKFIK